MALIAVIDAQLKCDSTAADAAKKPSFWKKKK
jgi:hypothetical protein